MKIVNFTNCLLSKTRVGKMKKVFIKSEKDLYSKLFIYRSLLCKNREFFIEEKSSDDAKAICTALNIKNKKKRIEYVYDYCINRVDEFYREKNYCNFENGQCKCQREENSNRKNGCCLICVYQTENGCPTQNLSCKLFYCNEISKKQEMFPLRDLKILKVFGFRRRLIAIDNFFAKREDVITDIEVGLLTFYSLRAIYRIIRNMVKVRY